MATKAMNKKSASTVRPTAVIRDVDFDAVYDQLSEYSRDPYRKLLAQALSSATDPQALSLLFQKSPDRFAQFVAIFSKLAGYNDTLQVELSLNQQLPTLSDAERAVLLEAKLKEREALMAAEKVTLTIPSEAVEHGPDDVIETLKGAGYEVVDLAHNLHKQ